MRPVEFSQNAVESLKYEIRFAMSPPVFLPYSPLAGGSRPKSYSLNDEFPRIANMSKSLFKQTVSEKSVAKLRGDFEHLSEVSPELFSKIDLRKVDSFLKGPYNDAVSKLRFGGVERPGIELSLVFKDKKKTGFLSSNTTFNLVSKNSVNRAELLLVRLALKSYGNILSDLLKDKEKSYVEIVAAEKYIQHAIASLMPHSTFLDRDSGVKLDKIPSIHSLTKELFFNMLHFNTSNRAIIAEGVKFLDLIDRLSTVSKDKAIGNGFAYEKIKDVSDADLVRRTTEYDHQKCTKNRNYLQLLDHDGNSGEPLPLFESIESLPKVSGPLSSQ